MICGENNLQLTPIFLKTKKIRNLSFRPTPSGLASPLPARQKALNDEALLYLGKALQLPLSEGKDKADVHALYAIVLQSRGANKGGPDKRKFYEV